MDNFIPVNTPRLIGNEKKYVMAALETGWISSEGPSVKEFEDKFSKRVNRKYGIAVSSGTAALEIAVKALEIGSGDEVILPTFSIISCAGAVVKTGATPVLVDSDPVTWNIDVSQIEAKITPCTRAIMVVHTYGLPVDMDRIISLAKKYNLKIIEDAAEMHGQRYRGKPCGSFGDLSIFSFYPNKHITTGEGGMIVTDNDILAEKCKSLRNLCFRQDQRFIHDELGWNYRFTNLQAALGLAQLEQLEKFVKIKRTMGKNYTQMLKDVEGIQLPIEKIEYAENIYWVYGIILNREVLFNAKQAMKMLGEMGIGTRPFFWPMHKQPVFQKMGLFKNETYPIAENLAERGFYIPSGLGLEEEEVTTVVRMVKQVLSHHFA